MIQTINTKWKTEWQDKKYSSLQGIYKAMEGDWKWGTDDRKLQEEDEV